MRCDIIIPVWDQPGHTRDCIEALMKNTSYPHRLILVDNGSAPETRDYLAGVAGKGRGVMLIRNHSNEGFVRAANQGLKASDAPYVCLLNNDTLPAPGWLERMVDFAERHKEAGLLNPVCDGHAGSSIEEYAGRLAANRGRYMEMNQCFGFCMLIKREVIDKIGYLDEAFGIGGFDDTDYSMRAHRAGYRSVCVHDAYVYHKEHVSFSAMGDRKKLVSPGEKAYFKKWPRHLRIGIGFVLKAGTTDTELESLMRDVIYLARQWCWVNLWIFGSGDEAKERVARAAEKTGMPLHQNIKYNYLGPAHAGAQMLVRLIERSFGTKARKRYDAVLVSGRSQAELLRAFAFIHRTAVYETDFSRADTAFLDALMARARSR